MKAKVVKLGLAALAVVTMVAGQALSRPQQFCTQSAPSGGGISIGGTISANKDRAAMLATMLGLTASQQNQAKGVFDEEEEVTRALVEQLKQASDALASAEKAVASDAEIDELATDLGSISGQLVAADAKAQTKIYAQLTEAQRQKLEQFPHPFFAPSAPLFPPGPVFISTSSPLDH